MIVYVVFGGMLATTWVQIIKAILLMSGTLLLSVLVLAHFGFSFATFFDAMSHGHLSRQGRGSHQELPGTRPEIRRGRHQGWGPLDLISLGLALVFGTAGLPHILVRFYTVPDAKTARVSVVWAMLHHRRLLHHDHVPRLRRGHHPDAGQHRGQRQANDMMARRCSPRLWRRDLLRLHHRGGLRHHPRGRRRPDHQRIDLLRARFLHQRHPPRTENGAGRGSARGPHHGLRGRRGCHRPRDPASDASTSPSWSAWPSPWRPPRICRSSCSLFWRRFTTTGAVCGLGVGLAARIVLILLSPRSWASTPRTSRRQAPSHSGAADLPADESRHRQHPARLPGRDGSALF